ncbi:hypothetical protein BC830DRAFT_457099 [Chytriomyces sp. MP71]|nr:hypothetical protein BC830DRAFT_457099 [Chytriomyces sp. MP71]
MSHKGKEAVTGHSKQVLPTGHSTSTPSVQPPVTRCHAISSSSSRTLSTCPHPLHSLCLPTIVVTSLQLHEDEKIHQTLMLLKEWRFDFDFSLKTVQTFINLLTGGAYAVLVLKQPKDVPVLFLSFPWPSMASDLPTRMRDSDTTSPLLCKNRISWIRANRC